MKKSIILILFTSVLSLTVYSQDFERGKELFKQNCASCHKMDSKMIGPPLINVVDKQGRDWVKKWVSNSQELISSGDQHANEIYQEYNMMAMPSYNWLEDSDLESIITYLEQYSTVENEKKVAVQPSVAAGDGIPIPSAQNSSLPPFIWVLIVICSFVLVVSLFAFHTALNTISSFVDKTGTTNNILLKKLDLTTKEMELELEENISSEVDKQVNKKIKDFKKDINTKLNNLK